MMKNPKTTIQILAAMLIVSMVASYVLHTRTGRPTSISSYGGAGGRKATRFK